MHTLRMASCLAAMAAISKSSVTSKFTPAFWTKSGKVLRLENFDFSFGVPRTAKGKSLAYRVCRM